MMKQKKQVRLRNVSQKDTMYTVKWKKDQLRHRMALAFDAKITYKNHKAEIANAAKSHVEKYLRIELRETKKLQDMLD